MYAALTLSTLLLLLIPTLFSSSYAACNKQDEEALLAFKNSFLHTSLDWSQSTDCCAWDYVGCDSATGRVTSLSFENDDVDIILNGSIPSSVGDLSSLETLRFMRIPSLQGPIPPQLSKLKKLQSLQLYFTQVSGPVPSFLSQLTSLKELQLGTNRFSGAIPPSIGDLAHLNLLYLSGNQLTGPIPASLFSKLANGSLKTLELSGNKLTGTIPPSLGDLADLTDINLSGNMLTGPIPASLGDLGNLTDINLSGNKFTGPIPASLFSKLPKSSLATLVLAGNKLTGPIPASFANVAFIGLYLQDNYLNGDASFLFGKSKPLININLAKNSLVFDFSKTEFPPIMDSMDISHNKIYGSIPNQIKELPNWCYIDVSYNQLCGKIPSSKFIKRPRKSYVHNKCLCGAPLQPCN